MYRVERRDDDGHRDHHQVQPVAELRDEDEIEEVVPAFDMREEIDFLNEVQQPRHVHQPEKRRRNGQDARRVALGNELTDAQAQHEDDQEAGLKIVRLGRGLLNAQQPRQIKKRARDQQLPAENSPAFKADQTALFNQPVKL